MHISSILLHILTNGHITADILYTEDNHCTYLELNRAPPSS